MAYQKLQAGNAADVYTSDTEDTINLRAVVSSGTLAATTSGATLVDNTGTFETDGVRRGDLVVNTTDGVASRVLSVTNQRTLVVQTTGLFASGEGYEVWSQTDEPAVLYVGGAGNVRVETVGGNDVTFNGLTAGQFVPVQVKRVYTTDTSATNLVALW